MSDRSENDQQGLSRRELLQRAGAGGLVLALPGVLGAAGTAAAAESQAAGGTLRAQVAWGTSESIDPQAVVGTGNDVARNFAVFQRLFAPDPTGKLKGVLAESIEGNKNATAWTVSLRQGVEWHDGSPFTADDVVYSLRRILTKKLGLEGFENLSMVNASGIKKLDARTVLIPTKFPYSDLVSQLADRMILIVKDGTTTFTALNGTGPFKYVGAQAGQRIMLEKNPNYWRPGRPFVDELELVNITDETARVNALRGGQVDLVETLGPASQRLLKNDSNVQLVTSKSGQWQPFVMDTKRKPFDDVNVRQAMRLLVDREELRRVVQGGQGLIGNDLYGPFDPLYASDIPQRGHRPDKAKFLLKKAGAEDLTFELNAANVGGGQVEAVVAFSQQAKKAGVKVTPKIGPADSYWNKVWLKVPFYISGWANRPLLSAWLLSLAPNAPQPETHWTDAKSARLLTEAMRTVDFAKRKEILRELQLIQWQSGGYIIWGFASVTSGARKNVRGLKQNVNRPLNDLNFEDISVA